jgi:hypothetical protein
MSDIGSDCDALNDTIINPSKDYKWFLSFLVTLLNEKSFNLINDKIIKNKSQQQTQQYILFDKIQNNNLEYYNNDNIKEFIKSMNINQTLYNYLINNNLYNYFLLPIYLKFLGFSCITFEYFDNNLYGGVYNYLKQNKSNKKLDFSINITKLNSSRGLIYDQRENNNNPDYLLINIWDNNNISFIKELINPSYIYDKNELNGKAILPLKNIIKYNGYNYYLISLLLTNYNTDDYKEKNTEHTISITKCKKIYAFTNYILIKPAYVLKSMFAGKEPEIKQCTKLIDITNLFQDEMVLSEKNYCELKKTDDKAKKKADEEQNNYCFSIKKGKRVLIYIKGDKHKTDEEIAKEKEELAEFKKKKAEENQRAEQEAKDAKAKKPEKPETPEQRAEREEKEKICTTIYDYLKKIKINKDKDDIVEKIKAEKEQINNLIKQLEEKEKAYTQKKKQNEDEINKKQKDHLEKLEKLITDFDSKFKAIPQIKQGIT